MPVYNAELYLREAIESILNQSYCDFHFLIVSDGSTDGSVDIIRSYSDPRIKLLQPQHMGYSLIMNFGLERADSKFLALMDSDDISLPNRLEKQIAFLEDHPEIGACGTWVQTIGDKSGQIWKYATDADEVHCRSLFNMSVAHPTLMLRLDTLNKSGTRYNPEYYYACDWEFLQQCVKSFSIANIPETLVHYRIREGSCSRENAERMKSHRYAIAAKALKGIGINVSDEQLNLHFAIVDRTFQRHIDKLHRIDEWLALLEQKNSISAKYPTNTFKKVIAGLWYEINSLAAEIGPSVWREFNRSDLRKLANTGLRLNVKLLLKSIIRWDRRGRSIGTAQ